MKTKKSIHKALRTYLDYFYKNDRKFTNYIDDKRLSQTEKNILLCWDLLKQNKFEEGLNILDKSTQENDHYIKAQKYYVKACLLNNCGQFNFALKYFEKSLELIEEYDSAFEKFNILESTFTIYQNLKMSNKMFEILKKMHIYENAFNISKIVFEQCYFRYFLTNSELENANQFRIKIQNKVAQLSLIDQVIFYISSFQFYVQKDDFEESKKMLLNLSKIRSFQNSSNFLFMKLLLEHYVSGKKLYIYEKDFNKDLFLFNQVMVIKCFEENKPDDAKKYWQVIQKQMPNVYQDNFQYLGEKSIFSLNLNKYSHVNESISLVLDENETKEQLLLKLIKIGITNKEALYHKIWGNKAIDKSDLNKLKKLVSRVREKLGVVIKYQKNCYKIAN